MRFKPTILPDRTDENYYWWDRRYPAHTWIPFAAPDSDRTPEEREAAIMQHMHRLMRQLDTVPQEEKGEEDSLVEALEVDWDGTVRQLKEWGWQGL